MTNDYATTYGTDWSDWATWETATDIEDVYGSIP